MIIIAVQVGAVKIYGNSSGGAQGKGNIDETQFTTKLMVF